MKLLVFFALICVFTACGSVGDNDIGGRLPMIIIDRAGITDGENSYCTASEILTVIGDDQPVPVAIAAQMLDAIGYSLPGNHGGMLTLSQTQEIIGRLHPTGHAIYLTDNNRDAYISYALWVELYMQLVHLDPNRHGIQKINIVPLAQRDGTVFTNIGAFGGKAVNLGAYFDMEIRVLHQGREIVAILGITNTTPTLKNALITHADAFGVSLFIGGAARNYVFADGVEPLDGNTIIANVQISGHEIIAATGAEAVIYAPTIERVRAHTIDFREWGALPLCPSFTVYKTARHAESNASVRHSGLDPESTRNSPQPIFTTVNPNSLLVGTNMAHFHVINGRIAAAIIVDDTRPANIRVVIGTSNFAGLVHESITITSTGDFTVSNGHSATPRTETISAGQTFTVSPTQNADLWGGLRLYIAPTDPANHRLEIVGLQRNWPSGQSPRYRGVFEISHYNGGGFLIVNELCIEEYLYAVVPSEMPTAHGSEAAKVQAITARSFAQHQFYQNAFRAFGAHVDDSVISQVYNNIPETEISVDAVNATRGQVLTVDGRLVIANYFSTSGGTTANFGEVWARGTEFPSETPTHLRSQPQFYADFDPGDLTQEENADAFFRRNDIPAIDRQFPWFRWQTTLTAAQLTAGINANINTRQAANPAMIQVLDAYGQPTNAVVQSIGQLTGLEIVARGQGGNIMEMIMTGTEAAVRVRTEFNIRSLLTPGAAPVTRPGGSYVTNLTLLPSAFFTMDIEKDTNGHIAAATFIGGGNGHGVGMSQNGVRTLVEMGLTYREIIAHYYPGVIVLP